jgi:hypothetical protein
MKEDNRNYIFFIEIHKKEFKESQKFGSYLTDEEAKKKCALDPECKEVWNTGYTGEEEYVYLCPIGENNCKRSNV